MALKALQREYRDLLSNPVPFGTVRPVGDHQPLQWVAALNGPQDSPYEGYQFDIEMEISTDYPTRGPTRLKFVTPVYHANIARNGFICLSLVSQWRLTD